MKKQIMTLAEHRRKNHQTFVRNKKAQGWRSITALVPPAVYDAMLLTKHAKMIEHRLLELQRKQTPTVIL